MTDAELRAYLRGYIQAYFHMNERAEFNADNMLSFIFNNLYKEES